METPVSTTAFYVALLALLAPRRDSSNSFRPASMAGLTPNFTPFYNS
jgi:hypothetical protein